MVAVNRLFRDFNRQPVDFQVELEAGYAVFGSADFKVHVSVVVFRANDVGEHNVLYYLAAFVLAGDKPAAYAGYGRLNRHACVHKAEAASANRSHRCGAV